MQDLENILMKFEKIVSPNFCNELAKKTKLIQRTTSRLKGHEFAQALMIPHAFLQAETLNSLAVRMHKINKTCNLSAPALAQRINTREAEAFMKACFGKMLKESMKKDFVALPDLHSLCGFNRILIEDSTQIELHEKLSPHFKGTATKAGVKIDYIFDYLSEEIINMEFFPASIADQKLASRLSSMLEKDDLVIRDLGYYALERLKEIELKEAYYLSRLKSDVVVYESQEAISPMDLANFLDRGTQRGIVDVEIFIGKEKHPARLIACLMSEEAVNKRRRVANRASQRRGNQISKKKLSLMKYCIFITNAVQKILSSTSITATYRARWRIELIFKQWKSCLKMHIFKGFNKERFFCLLYGRLIMILLLGAISPPLMLYALTLGRELSCYKLINYFIADHAFPRAVYEGKMDQFIDQLIKDTPQRLCMEKRKRLSLRNNVKLGNSYYNELKIMELYVDDA